MNREDGSNKEISMNKSTLKQVKADVYHKQEMLAAQWAGIQTRLQFQVPAVDERGWPFNIYLLDTLREALAVYARMVALDSVRMMLKLPMTQKGTKEKKS